MPKKTLIAGAGDAGRLVLSEIRKEPQNTFLVAGFLDDDPQKTGQTISGIKVLGKISEAEKWCRQTSAEEIILAVPSAKGLDKRRMIQECTVLGVRLRILPGIFDILRGNVSISKLREPVPEDLIGRKTASFNPAELKAVFEGKTVLVTGGAGSIGSELMRKLPETGCSKIVLLDIDENGLYFNWVESRDSGFPEMVLPVVCNIRERKKVFQIFSKYSPEIVFHAAASKQVPMVEQNTAEGIKNNVIGTKNVLDAAIRSKAEQFVLISTDKAVSPSSMMGSTKRVAEWVCQQQMNRNKPRIFVARFGNVFGSKGSVIPLFLKQIKERREITITDKNMTRYFMSIEEAVALLLKLCSMEKSGVYFFDMGEQIKILDLGIELIKLQGLVPEKDVKITEIGLRQGEKISEMLITENETKKSTAMENIIEVIPGKKSLEEAKQETRRLLEKLKAEKDEEALQAFSSIVKPLL